MSGLPFPVATALASYAEAQRAFMRHPGVRDDRTVEAFDVRQRFCAARNHFVATVQVHRAACPAPFQVLFARATLALCEDCTHARRGRDADATLHDACARRVRSRADAVARLVDLGHALAGCAVPWPWDATTRASLRANAGFRDACRAGDGRLRGWVAVYRADAAGIDVDADSPFVASCETHHTHVANATLTLARASMRDPAAWCEACADAEAVDAGEADHA